MALADFILQALPYLFGFAGGAFGLYKAGAMQKIKEDKFRLEVTQESYEEKKDRIKKLENNAGIAETGIKALGEDLEKALNENTQLSRLSEAQSQRISALNLVTEKLQSEIDLCRAERENLTLDIGLEKKNTQIAEKERDLATAQYLALKDGLGMIHVHVNYKGEISGMMEGENGKGT